MHTTAEGTRMMFAKRSTIRCQFRRTSAGSANSRASKSTAGAVGSVPQVRSLTIETPPKGSADSATFVPLSAGSVWFRVGGLTPALRRDSPDGRSIRPPWGRVGPPDAIGKHESAVLRPRPISPYAQSMPFDKLRADLDQLFPQARQRPFLDAVRQRQRAQEVGEIVAERVELQPDGFGGERAA